MDEVWKPYLLDQNIGKTSEFAVFSYVYVRGWAC